MPSASRPNGSVLENFCQELHASERWPLIKLRAEKSVVVSIWPFLYTGGSFVIVGVPTIGALIFGVRGSQIFTFGFGASSANYAPTESVMSFVGPG